MNLENINYDKLSLEEQQTLHTFFREHGEEKTQIVSKLNSIIYRLQPPTPEEYLDYHNEWITKAFAESVLPHVREDFIEILDQKKKYKQVVEYGATRLGKSFLVRLLIHYTVIYIHCLRHPQLYYGLSPTTNLSIYIMSFVTEKVNQILLKPIYDMFKMSPRFKQVIYQDKVSLEQEQAGLNTIVWSKASTFGHLTLDSGLSLNVGTDFMSFIGSDMIQLYVSEINFFTEKAGATHEEIFQIYSDGVSRIRATIGRNYLGYVFLDSSANNSDNKIEKHILYEIPKQERTFYRVRSQWDAMPHMFPIWQETGKTFTVCIGDGAITPKMIQSKYELEDIPKNLIIEVPIDVKEDFETNLVKSIKDIAGRPTRNENKFINNSLLINNIFDNPLLKNIEGKIIADSATLPENLIWDKIQPLFFNQHYGENNFVIKRASQEPRFLHVDPATSSKGDLLGLCMLHKEWSREINQTLFVTDFCFAVGPGENGINLTAIEEFIVDLRDKGRVTILRATTDTYQSKMMEQSLKRKGIVTDVLSVDISLDPYLLYLNCLHNKVFKSGKNIFLKNNSESLIRIKSGKSQKEKIDHTLGTTENNYNGDWNTSMSGIHAKDVSDSACGALFSAYNNPIVPTAVYEDENKKISPIFEDKKEFIDLAYKRLKKF